MAYRLFEQRDRLAVGVLIERQPGRKLAFPAEQNGQSIHRFRDALQRPPTADASQPPPTRPPLEEMVELAYALIQRSLRDRARAAIEERIQLQEIEAAALAALPRYENCKRLWTLICRRLGARSSNKPPPSA